jgi:outer membrane biosynthesis protein TonB
MRVNKKLAALSTAAVLGIGLLASQGAGAEQPADAPPVAAVKSAEPEVTTPAPKKAEPKAEKAAPKAEAEKAAPKAEKPAPKAEPKAETPKKPAAKAAEAEVSLSAQNAVGSAESYLEYSGFSRKGLIGQLEYEGYSTADATYAADNVAVDWNEECAQSAQSYMDYSSFSKSGLADQLDYEGFSDSQIAHGLKAVGY